MTSLYINTADSDPPKVDLKVMGEIGNRKHHAESTA